MSRANRIACCTGSVLAFRVKHLLGYRRRRFTVDTLALETPVIDTDCETRLPQCFVGYLRPALADSEVFVPRGAEAPQVPLPSNQLECRSGANAIRRDLT